MKICLFIVCLVGSMTQHVLAQKNIPNFDHTLLLESISDTTANVSLADFDGDGHLDILLVKGRHWPIIDRVLLGDGRGGIRKAYDLGTIADRSYTGGVADFNGDGFPDIAVSNDNPDRKLVYFNDGKGKFTVGSEFGRPEWPTRNLAVADINGDGFPDLILANRGDLGNTSNYICLNNGKGQFDSTCIAFAPYPATTIYPVDINKDGFIDLVVPHRDGGQSYVYLGSADRTYTDAHRIPFGPSNATIRMAAAADLNGDGLMDIVTIDEHKGVDLYLGQKNHTFSAGISLADSTIVPYALTIADLNNDKKMDIIVGHIEAPSTVFFNDGKGHFKSISFGDTTGTVYGFAVSDFNEDGIPDIAAARSEGPNVLYFGSNNSTTEYFGQDLPGETPEIFAPGFISKPDRYELMTAYAPDGKEFCFTVTNEHWSHFEIWHTLFEDGKWTEPQKMPFANSMECFGPAFSLDNTGMFFSSANWVTHPATIWYSARLRDGWRDPVRCDPTVNAGTDQWQSSIAKDGALVFAARRAGGKGEYDLYLSEPVHHHYNKVSNLVDLNSPADEYSAFIAPDKSYIIFSSQRAGGYGWDDLYISFRKQKGWTEPINLGPAINAVNAEFSPQVTPDGHFLLYSKWDAKNKWSDIYWVRIDKTIDRLKKEAFEGDRDVLSNKP